MLRRNWSALAERKLIASVALVIAPVLVMLALPAVAAAQAAAVAPPAAPPSFASKCTSCVSSLGGILASSKQSCCSSPLGALINGAFQPLKFATGGVIPSPCPGPGEPSHKPGTGTGAGTPGPPGPEQAAEAIKQDQAQAKARAAAVRYLATVPCHYYPEAEVALITALRTDRSECVRWEAAHALAQGCCCTKRTIAALKITAEASQKDSNPREMSMRVRVEAMNALQHCLAMCGDTVDQPQRPEAPSGEPETIPTPPVRNDPVPKRPETPATYNVNASQAVGNVQPAGYYDQIETRSTRALLDEARQLVESVRPVQAPLASTPRGRSLFELWHRASEPVTPPRSTVPSLVSAEAVAAQIGAATAPGGSPTFASPSAHANFDHHDPSAPSVSVLRRPAEQNRLNTAQTNVPPTDLARASRLGAPLFGTPPAMTESMSTNRTSSTAFEPSNQWLYPPLQEPIRMALDSEELRPLPPNQRDRVWR